METNLGRTVCLGKGCEQRTSPSNQLESYAETAWLGLGWRSLARSFVRGYVSQCVATANSHDLCTHNTSMCRGRRGWKACIWPEPVCHIWTRVHIRLRCSHQWTREDCRASTLWSCLRVRFTSLDAISRKLHFMYTDTHKSNCIHLSSVWPFVLMTCMINNFWKKK